MSSPRPAAAQARAGLAGLPWLAAGALVLLAPALLWGRPFVFGDSVYYWTWGGDILDALRHPWPGPHQAWIAGRSLHGWGLALHDTTPAALRFNLTWLTARSSFYAVPFHLLVASGGGLWLVAALQALACAWTVAVAFRAAAPLSGRSARLLAVAALALVSSLGIEAPLAMPDVFGGLAVLAAGLLFAFSERLHNAERLGLVALIAYAALAHAENAVNVAGVAASSSVMMLAYRRGWRSWVTGVAPTIAALVVALGVAAIGGAILGWAFGRALLFPPYAESTLLANGQAQAYLRQTCPDERLAACDLSGMPPADSDYYRWIYPLEPPAGLKPADVLAQYQRLEFRRITGAEADKRERFVREQAQVVFGALRTDGSSVLRSALVGGLAALVNSTVHRDFDSVRLTTIGGRTLFRDQLDAVLPGRVECVTASAACGHFDLNLLVPLEMAALIASLLLFAAGWIGAIPGPTRPLSDFVLLVLAAMLVNAAACGAVSGPFDRYGARIAWVLPLAAAMYILQRADQPSSRAADSVAVAG